MDDAIPRARLGRLGAEIVWLPRVGSTNDVALDRASADGDHEGLIVIADEQTAGRGRRGHAWFSPAGSGLYASVVLTPARSIDPRRATLLVTLAAGVAIAEGIDAACALAVDLKWPNDLYVGRRKLGGILAEASSLGDRVSGVVLGFGINLQRAAYPSDVADRATSIETELGRRVDRAHVLVESLAALARRYDDLLAGRFDAILDAWRRRAPAATGARVAWSGRHVVTAGIDAEGALLVEDGGRVERIVSGEIDWL